MVQADSGRRSVGSEDDDGVDSGSSRGDDVAGYEGNSDHQDWEPDEDDQIGRADFEQQADQKAAETEGADQPDSNADRGQSQSVTNDQPEYVPAVRAQCDPNTDFAEALGVDVRQDAVDFRSGPAKLKSAGRTPMTV